MMHGILISHIYLLTLNDCELIALYLKLIYNSHPLLRPVLYLPTGEKYTLAVRFCPLLFTLRTGTPGTRYSGQVGTRTIEILLQRKTVLVKPHGRAPVQTGKIGEHAR